MTARKLLVTHGPEGHMVNSVLDNVQNLLCCVPVASPSPSLLSFKALATTGPYLICLSVHCFWCPLECKLYEGRTFSTLFSAVSWGPSSEKEHLKQAPGE